MLSSAEIFTCHTRKLYVVFTPASGAHSSLRLAAPPYEIAASTARNPYFFSFRSIKK
jgi:hypothetical protein